MSTERKITIKDFIRLGGDNCSKTFLVNRVYINTKSDSAAKVAKLLWDLLFDTDYLRKEVRDVVLYNYSGVDTAIKYNYSPAYIRKLVTKENRKFAELCGEINLLGMLEGEVKAKDDLLEGCYQIIKEVYDAHHVVSSGTRFKDLLTINIGEVKPVRHEGGPMDEETLRAIIKGIGELRYLSKSFANKSLGSNQYLLGRLMYIWDTAPEYLTQEEQKLKAVIQSTWWIED